MLINSIFCFSGTFTPQGLPFLKLEILYKTSPPCWRFWTEHKTANWKQMGKYVKHMMWYNRPGPKYHTKNGKSCTIPVICIVL